MKTLKVNGKKITIPTKWSEVLLKDYEQWQTNKSDNRNIAQCIANLCNMEIQDLTKAPKELLGTILESLKFLSEPNLESAVSMIIDNDVFILTDLNRLTLGEWVDVDAVLNDDKCESVFSSILAIVCRPIGEEYNHENVATRAQLFREQTCDKVLPLISFFLRREQNLKETFNHFSTVLEAGNQLLEVTKSFAQNGDGIKRLPIWQRIRFYFLTRSLEKQLSKFSVSSSIE